MNKKKVLSQILDRSFTLRAVHAIESRPFLTILAYHRVRSFGDDFMFDSGLISADPEEFEWQVDYLKKNYSVISFSDFLENSQNPHLLPSKPLVISFDDGYDDNYLDAFAVLKSAQVPGTFFISTDYIGTSKPFWFDWVYYLCNFLTDTEYRLDSDQLILNLNKENLKTGAYFAPLIRYLKSVPDDTRLRVISELENMVGITEPEDGLKDCMPANWQQIKEMHQNGMEIASHSRSHPILSQLSPRKLADEISGSRKEIELKLGSNVEVIAYPVGGPTAFNEETIRIVKNAGYSAACSYISGANYYSSLNMFALNRLHVEKEMDRRLFKAMVALPGVFA